MAHDDAKNLHLFWVGGRAKAEVQYTTADVIARAGRVGRGLTKGGGILVRVDASLLPCGGVTRCHDDENFIMAAGAKWLGRSIFVGKTNLGGRFWQRSGMHDPHQRATMSLKLGESDVNVT